MRGGSSAANEEEWGGRGVRSLWVSRLGIRVRGGSRFSHFWSRIFELGWTLEGFDAAVPALFLVFRPAENGILASFPSSPPTASLPPAFPFLFLSSSAQLEAASFPLLPLERIAPEKPLPPPPVGRWKELTLPLGRSSFTSLLPSLPSLLTPPLVSISFLSLIPTHSPLPGTPPVSLEESLWRGNSN